MNKTMKIAKCLLLLGVAFILAGPQPVHAQNQKPSTTPAPDYNCQVAGHPWQLVYQDLKGVALFVSITPVHYSLAVECHGHENECADKYGITDSRGPSYIKELKDDYNSYPPSLHYDNIVRVFTDAINQKIQPYVVPVNCKRPPVAIYGIDDLRPVSTKEKNKDILTIVVRLEITDSVGILRTDFYRPDESHSDFASQALLGRTSMIPLGLPDEKINAWLAGNAKSFEIYTHENLEVLRK